MELTKRQRFHLAHKDEEEYMERNRQLRRESYARNAEKERTKALERYYAKKAVLEAEKLKMSENPIS
jgi:hypothetical protein